MPDVNTFWSEIIEDFRDDSKLVSTDIKDDKLAYLARRVERLSDVGETTPIGMGHDFTPQVKCWLRRQKLRMQLQEVRNFFFDIK
jgi:hypothetical protein